jgi:hypothetical protein
VKKQKLTPQRMEKVIEALNIVYLSSVVQGVAWEMNKDINLGNPNLNNFNKRIKNDSLAILKGLHAVPKCEEMAEDRAIALYSLFNFLSQYDTESLESFYDKIQNEII